MPANIFNIGRLSVIWIIVQIHDAEVFLRRLKQSIWALKYESVSGTHFVFHSFSECLIACSRAGI